MTPAGHIHIRLQPGDGARPVVIGSTRPQYPARLFIGKSLDVVLQAIPLLFNVCRGAQSVAAARAAEQVLGTPAAAPKEDDRESLLRLEMLHEHLWKLLLDLPPVLGLAARQREMAAASRQLRRLMVSLRQSATVQSTSPGGERSPLDSALVGGLRDLLFGTAAVTAHTWDTLSLGGGLAGALLRAAAPLDWSTANRPESLPAIDPQTAGSLAGAQDPDYCIQQYLSSNSCFETGALSRMSAHPLIEPRRSTCLTVRLAALLLETDKLLGDTGQPRCGTPAAPASRAGVSQVETSRGCLTHILSLASGVPVVEKMLVLAPTDWNFHPRGIVARLLSEQPMAAGDRFYRAAELLIKLVNPCVAYRLQVAGHSARGAAGYA